MKILMKNYKEDLGIILDLLEEWCQESGASYVTANVSAGECSSAWDRVNKEYRFDIARDYEKAETPGAATPRESR